MPHMAFGGRVAVCGAISGYNKQEEEEEGAMTGWRWDSQILLFILRILLVKNKKKKKKYRTDFRDVGGRGGRGRGCSSIV